MPNTIDLHDATFKGLEVDWKIGSCVVSLVTANHPDCALIFAGMKKLQITRELEWGMSCSVNHFKERSKGEFELELQSGDRLYIESQICTFELARPVKV